MRALAQTSLARCCFAHLNAKSEAGDLVYSRTEQLRHAMA